MPLLRLNPYKEHEIEVETTTACLPRTFHNPSTKRVQPPEGRNRHVRRRQQRPIPTTSSECALRFDSMLGCSEILNYYAKYCILFRPLSPHHQLDEQKLCNSLQNSPLPLTFRRGTTSVYKLVIIYRFAQDLLSSLWLLLCEETLFLPRTEAFQAL